MKYLTSSLFDRLFKKLDSGKQKEAKRTISELIAFFDSGLKSEGLGLKRLRGNIWEIRASIKERILFSFESNVITFLIIGNHDDIRKYLRQ